MDSLSNNQIKTFHWHSWQILLSDATMAAIWKKKLGNELVENRYFEDAH